MHPPSGSNNPAADMIVKRLLAASIVLSLGMMLSACGGYVADHWPHWAGGLPSDAPPRPGSAGYEQFIAHGQPAQNAAAPADGATTGAATGTTSSPAVSAPASAPQAKTQNGKVKVGHVQSPPPRAATQAASEAPAPAEPVETPPAEDTSVVKGGLY
jgi:hypothetical protein